MNTKCKICGKDLIIKFNSIGLPITSQKYCSICGPARTKILSRLKDDEKKLKRHYDHLETELKVIAKIKELINIGQDTDERTREFLKTGKRYWDEYNLREFYHPEKKVIEDPYAKDKI